MSQAEFISQPMRLTQAASKALEVCQALGIDSGHGTGIGSLEEKASQLQRLGDQTPLPQYWNGRGEKDGIRYSITVNPLLGRTEARGKVYVVCEFYQWGQPMKALREPIKPPPGYEGLSMEPPKK